MWCLIRKRKNPMGKNWERIHQPMQEVPAALNDVKKKKENLNNDVC